MRTEDYPRELVEKLLPSIFDRTYAWGMTDESAPDPQMPRSPGLKNRGNTLWAHLADIRRAYDLAPLTVREAQAIVLCGGMGLGLREASKVVGIGKSSMQVAYDAAVTKLYDFLNGTAERVELPAVAA